MFQKILVATDGSEASRRAVQQTLALAKVLGAKVVAVHVTVTSAHLMLGSFDLTALPAEVREAILRNVASELAWVGQQSDEAGVECAAVNVESEQPWRGIIDTARARGCDLIAMASHGRRGLAGRLLGSETQKVLTHGELPVLVFR